MMANSIVNKYFKYFKHSLRTSRIKRCCRESSSFERALRGNELKKEYEAGTGVKKLFVNQVGSHTPNQDMWGEARLLHSGDLLFGVFDGNNGIACSHVVAKRIFKYIAVSLLPKDILTKFVEKAEDRFSPVEILKSTQDKHYFLEEYRRVYDQSLYTYANDLLKNYKKLEVPEALIKSFERLDSDLSREALEDTSPDKRILWVGMTGTCATVLHMSGGRLTTASIGDAMVVVGTMKGETKVLTPEHSALNAREVERLKAEHPGEEGILEQGLLLGSLTSFRSFGNFRYKWKKELLEEKVVPVYGMDVVPAKSLSPPYITARPEVGHYDLKGDDSFVIIATDGIWDIFPPSKAVKIVAKHKPASLLTKVVKFPLLKLQKLKKIVRNEDEKEDIVFSSPATQLIMEGLETTSKKLHLPKRYYRIIRDDMTAIVFYLDKGNKKNHLGNINNIIKEDSFPKKLFAKFKKKLFLLPIYLYS